MKPSAPKYSVWLISVILGILGIVSHFVQIDNLSQYSFWMILVALILLLLGTSLKGI